MFTSPVPIYLGCAGLIVGSLGLGAERLMSGSSAPVPTSAQEQPLFAKSVEEAALPATHWPSQNPEVAFYEPMVELLATPARIAEPSQSAAPRQEEPPAATPREVVRDVPHEQVKQSSRRAKNSRSKNESASNEPSDQTIRERGRAACRSPGRRRRKKRRTASFRAPLSGAGGIRAGGNAVPRGTRRATRRHPRRAKGTGTLRPTTARKRRIQSVPAVRHLRPALSDLTGVAYDPLREISDAAPRDGGFSICS